MRHTLPNGSSQHVADRLGLPDAKAALHFVREFYVGDRFNPAEGKNLVLQRRIASQGRDASLPSVAQNDISAEVRL
jgi:hypothetical protein